MTGTVASQAAYLAMRDAGLKVSTQAAYVAMRSIRVDVASQTTYLALRPPPENARRRNACLMVT